MICKVCALFDVQKGYSLNILVIISGMWMEAWFWFIQMNNEHNTCRVSSIVSTRIGMHSEHMNGISRQINFSSTSSRFTADSTISPTLTNPPIVANWSVWAEWFSSSHEKSKVSFVRISFMRTPSWKPHLCTSLMLFPAQANSDFSPFACARNAHKKEVVARDLWQSVCLQMSHWRSLGE